MLRKIWDFASDYYTPAILLAVIASEGAWVSLILAPLALYDFANVRRKKQIRQWKQNVDQAVTEALKAKADFERYRSEANEKLESIKSRLKGVQRQTLIQYVCRPGKEPRQFRLEKIKDSSVN